MKLYTKTLLLIITLIITQAVLTAVIVIRLTSAANVQDARAELQRESSLINDSYNTWKRHLWKQLTRIDSFISERAPGTIDEEDISRLLLSTNVDGVVVKSGDQSFNIQTISTSAEFILPPAEKLEIFYQRPYLAMYYIDQNLYLAGVSTHTHDGNKIHVILIKHINESFLRNLVFDTKGRVLFHTDKDILAGNFDEREFLFDHDLKMYENSYSEYYNVAVAEQAWNIAIRKCGALGDPSGEGRVYLTTLLSNEYYIKRILNIERSFVNVSLIIILLTTLISLQISRSITRPVSRLLSAMEEIRKGSFDVQIPSNSRNEVGKLLEGFNDMALHLREDQEQIRDSMNEILFLNRYNEQVFNSIRDSIAVIDPETGIEKSNAAFRARFIPKNGTAVKLTDLNSTTFDETVIANIREVLEGKRDSRQQRIRDRNAIVYELKAYPLISESSDGGRNIRCVLLLEDISQKVEYEEKIFQAEKLSSLSMLSAGIAHEVNNPLSSILTNIQNLIYDETEADKRDQMVLIEAETRRIADIIRDLMDFTSRDQDRMPLSDPAALAGEVGRLLKHSMKKEGGPLPEIIVEQEGEIPLTAISKGELMQIYINLIQNALHATGFLGPVHITLESRPSEKTVAIRVIDEGIGIEPTALKRVFDPFYTTKSNGEGTGLGLSVVYGIINKYNGKITINSRPGEGTEAAFTLPAAENGGA